MSGRPVSEEELRATLKALETHGNVTKAAKSIGLSRDAFENRLFRAEERRITVEQKVEFPSFVIDGDEDEPIEEMLSRVRKAYERKQKAEQARQWFPIKIKEDRPYGVAWFGDPHLSSGNFPLLESHLAIARQEGIYGANIGDTQDNWPWTGRLAKLWSETDVSNKTERRLASWFMFEAGVSWLVWLMGNHDAWNGGSEFYKQLGAHHVPILDWRAQFRLVHPNGSETRIDAAHGRKGSSLYNPTHGSLRDAKFGEDCDAYITGHTHNFGLFEIEFPERRTKSWLAQISGYKDIDLHSKTNGFAPAQYGAAVLQIVYPETGKTTFFSDLAEGAEFLSWLRSR